MADTMNTVNNSEMLEFQAYRGLDLVRGENATLVDGQGRSYIDLASGHGVMAVGHCHPRIVAAVQKQSARLLSCPASFGSPPRQELIQSLKKHSPASLHRFFFCNSGTEAVEAALKLAFFNRPRKRLIAFRGGFHGRTLGALGLTFNPRYREPFLPLTPQVEFLPYNDIQAAKRAIDDRVCAVVLEAVQGEGGVIPGRPDFLQEVAERCRLHDCLLILDEVQTGGGRTGAFWALEHSGIVPDILCFAKALGGGLPFGGIACGERIGEKTGIHGSTFGGNPLACASARAAVQVIEKEKLCFSAREKGAMAMEQLRQIRSPRIKETRGLGLMIGIELDIPVTRILSTLQHRGVIALAAGPKVLRLLPPLTIPTEELSKALSVIGEVLCSAGRPGVPS